MSNWSRRPISSRPSGGVLPCSTRKELERRLAEEGRKLVLVRSNHGQWNDQTTYYAVFGDDSNPDNWFLLDSAFKGERRDWDGMWSHFMTGRGMFSR